MISVGIDVSKGKSTVIIMKPCGKNLTKAFEVRHIKKDLEQLSSMISELKGEVKIVLEATGIYHLPILQYLNEKGFFVAVINPLEMKKYKSQRLRPIKTDKQDAKTIANYGLDNWYHLKNYVIGEDIYKELKLLGRQYAHYMRLHISNIQELTHLLDYTMPGLKKLLKGWDKDSGKNKLADFVEKYWHFANITKLSEEKFVEQYNKWAKEKGYHQSQEKARIIYNLAKEGIPTISRNQASLKMLIMEAIRVMREVDHTLYKILTQMKELAKSLPEYEVVRAMGGVGDNLATKLIAEIGDVRRFHAGKALIAYAGIDAPPYQSGQFTGTKRKISKKGSSLLRKIGYEVMRSLKSHKAPKDDCVYNYILKKESEGKAKKSAKIAGLNKFLRIYYARVQEVYSTLTA